MPSLNRIVLIGRLTNDPELRYTASNLAVASFTVAVDRPFKGQDGEKKTDFFRCKAWRQKAEFVDKYVKKGRLVAVEGRVELNDYVGQDGQKRYLTEISVDQVETLDSMRERGDEPAPIGGGHGGGQQGYGGGGNYGAPQRGGDDHGYQNSGGGGNGYYADEPAPARPAQRPPAQQAPQQRPPAQRPAPQPAYPADDDFDDSDPFADE